MSVLKLGKLDWPIGNRCGVFGVLNITPDSFSDGGRYLDPVEAVCKGESVKEGADVIDIGENQPDRDLKKSLLRPRSNALFPL